MAYKVLGVPAYSVSDCNLLTVTEWRDESLCEVGLLESMFLEGLLQYHSERDLVPWPREEK